MPKELVECANPKCKAKFYPYNSKHITCNKRACKIWLRFEGPNAYSKVKYRFTKEFIRKCFDNRHNFNIETLTFTHDDLERIEE